MKEYITYIIKDYQHKLCPFEFNVKVLSQCKNLMLIKMHNVHQCWLIQSNEETAKVERCNNFFSSKIESSVRTFKLPGARFQSCLILQF